MDGTNSLVVKATDLRGNTTTTPARSFTYHRTGTLTLTRAVPDVSPDPALNPDDVGNIVAINALFPTTANLNPKTANVQIGKTVTLIPTTKSGFMFKGFTTTPSVTLTAGAGGRVSFDMVSGLSVTAEWVKSPYLSGAGTYVGLVKAHTGTTASNATEGFTRLVLTNVGTFSGTLNIDGAIHVISGSFDAVGASFFGVAKTPTLTIDRSASSKPNLVVDFAFNAAAGNNQITGSVTADTKVSDVVADKAIYSTTNTVPSALLNVSATAPRGYYTMVYPSKAQTPTKTKSTYPQGDGYATITLLNNGTVTVTSFLADGTIAVGVSVLVEGNKAPIFTQILTPGSTTVKGSSFGGMLTFNVQTDSDVLGTDLEWFRAQAATTGGTAATDLYTAGWPDGVKVDALGAQYNSATDVATAIGLGAVDTTNGNGKLVFSDGKLTGPVTKTKFNITASVVSKIPVTDVSYTLTPVQSTGTFSGIFTPNWSNPATAKPLYRGILLQKGSNKGGYGFFLSNISADADPESGGVTVSAQ